MNNRKMENESLAVIRHGNKKYLRLVYLFICCSMVVIGWTSLNRTVFNYFTETDFLGGTVSEASRFLTGERLQIDFHPPFYAVVLSVMYLLVEDWLKAGLILSLVSCFVVLLTSYKMLADKFGFIAGIGAIVGCMASIPFTMFAIQATSDIFFLSLFFCALSSVCIAAGKDIPRWWLIAGLFVGLAIITRTNGFVLGLSILFVLTLKDKSRIRKAIIFMIIGIIIPVGSWFYYSQKTQSPFLPTATFENLALTYFAPGNDRITADARHAAAKGLNSTLDVILKDPIHVTKTYAKDLLENSKRLFWSSDLIPFPFGYLALPGLLILLGTKRDRFTWILLINLGAMFLLTNFKSWETRYYLFMLPFIGAGLGLLWQALYQLATRMIERSPLKNRSRMMSALTIVSLLGISIAISLDGFGRSLKRMHWPYGHLAFDAVAASKVLNTQPCPEGAYIVARKPHLGFYTNMDLEFFPNVDSLAELKAALKTVIYNREYSGRCFLFYGLAEGWMRKNLAILADSAIEVPWLARISRGNESGGWVLYEVCTEKLSDHQAKNSIYPQYP